MTSPAYRHLRDLPPIESSGKALALPTDARRLAAWVAALPRANPAVVQAQLRDALDALIGQRLSGGVRFDALEMLRSPVLEAIAQLEGQFVGATFPLPAAKVRAAQDAERFHVALAHGYRLAAADLCTPSGKPPMLRGGTVATALGRAVHHYGAALAKAWQVYRAPQPGSWQGLHRCHAFAVECGLGGKTIEDPLAGSRQALDAIYGATLLASLCNPYAHSQTEQEALWALARAYAPQCPLSGEGGPDARIMIDPESDCGPGIGGGGPDGAAYLDTSRLRADIARALAHGEGSSLQLSPSRGVVVQSSRKLLESVQRSLGQAVAARAEGRLPGGHVLDCVIGLSVLHYYLAGRLDFDAFVRQAREGQIQMVDRAAWAHAGGELARLPPVPTQVLDQSLHGYRVAWGSQAQARARVGELVGLSLADEPDEERDWMVGIIRWLRYEADGGISAGIELLARRARAVGLCGLNGRADERPPLRALALLPLNGEAGPRYLSQDGDEFDGSEVEILRPSSRLDGADADIVGASRVRLGLLHNGGDYVLFGTCASARESFS